MSRISHLFNLFGHLRTTFKKCVQSAVCVRTLIRIALFTMGDFESVKRQRGYKNFIMTCMFVLTLGSVIGFLNTNTGIVDKMSSLITIIPPVVGASIFLHLFNNRKNIKKLLWKMENENYAGHNYVLQYVEVWARKKLIWQLGTLFAILGVPLSQIILQSLQGGSVTAKYSLLLPFWFSCDESNETHVILQKVCYSVKTKPELLLVNTVQSFTVSLILSFSNAALALYMITIYELSAHVEILKSKIRATNDAMNRQYDSSSEQLRAKKRQKILDDEIEIIGEHLIPVIQYQQFLKSCAIDLVDTWTWCATNAIVIAFATLAILVYTAVMEYENAPMCAFRAGMTVVFLIMAIFLVCWYGYYVAQVNEIIFDELCTIPWYQQGTRFRKLYGIALTLSRGSDAIKIIGMYDVGLRTIESLIKTSYSVLNAVIVLQKK